MAGYPQLFRPAVTARVATGWESPARVRQFMPARITGSPGEGYRCEPSAGTLTGLSRSNAFAVVPEDVSVVAAGDAVSCLILDA